MVVGLINVYIFKLADFIFAQLVNYATKTPSAGLTEQSEALVTGMMKLNGQSVTKPQRKIEYPPIF